MHGDFWERRFYNVETIYFFDSFIIWRDMSSETTAGADQTCRTCHKCLPIDSFRPIRRKGKSCRPDSQCRACYNGAMVELRKRRKTESIKRFARDAKWVGDPTRMQRLVDAMLEEFGGPKGFAAVFVDYVRGEIDRGNSSKPIVDALLTTIKLAEIVER